MDRLKMFIRDQLIDLYFMNIDIRRNYKQWLIPLIYIIINFIFSLNNSFKIVIISFVMIYTICTDTMNSFTSLMSLLLSVYTPVLYIRLVLLAIILYESVVNFERKFQQDMYTAYTNMENMMKPMERFNLDCDDDVDYDDDYYDDNDIVTI